MSTLTLKKRGRPTNAELARRKALQPKPKTDAEVLADLVLRFDMLRKLTGGALRQHVRALVVTGAPGVGKSYNVHEELDNTPNARYHIIGGGISAIGLYKLGYQYRNPGNVLVMDDSDGIFKDEEALNVLKALCDTSLQRQVSWYKESAALKAEGGEGDIPQQYDFNGAMIFISNLNMQAEIDRGNSKYVPHFEALMSRALYLDLQLFSPQARYLWVKHVATVGKIFRRENVSDATGEQILNWIGQHRDSLRELSVRTVTKMCQIVSDNPTEWRDYGRVLLCRA